MSLFDCAWLPCNACMTLPRASEDMKKRPTEMGTEEFESLSLAEMSEDQINDAIDLAESMHDFRTLIDIMHHSIGNNTDNTVDETLAEYVCSALMRATVLEPEKEGSTKMSSNAAKDAGEAGCCEALLSIIHLCADEAAVIEVGLACVKHLVGAEVNQERFNSYTDFDGFASIVLNAMNSNGDGEAALQAAGCEAIEVLAQYSPNRVALQDAGAIHTLRSAQQILDEGENDKVKAYPGRALALLTPLTESEETSAPAHAPAFTFGDPAPSGPPVFNFDFSDSRAPDNSATDTPNPFPQTSKPAFSFGNAAVLKTATAPGSHFAFGSASASKGFSFSVQAAPLAANEDNAPNNTPAPDFLSPYGNVEASKVCSGAGSPSFWDVQR